MQTACVICKLFFHFMGRILSLNLLRLTVYFFVKILQIILENIKFYIHRKNTLQFSI